MSKQETGSPQELPPTLPEVKTDEESIKKEERAIEKGWRERNHEAKVNLQIEYDENKKAWDIEKKKQRESREDYPFDEGEGEVRLSPNKPLGKKYVEQPKEESPEPITEEKSEVRNLEQEGFVSEKLLALGITQEEFEKLEGFEDIKNDAGRQLFVLNNLEQVKYKNIKDRAEQEHEMHVNDANGKLGKIWRNAFKDKKIRSRERDILENGVSLDEIKDETEALIGISKVGPNLKIEEGGKSLIAEYLDPTTVNSENYNRLASAYAMLPRESDRKYYSAKEREQFQHVKNDFEKERFNILNILKESYGETKALSMVNLADFKAKVHHSLIYHPEVEIELQKLNKSTGAIEKLKDFFLNSQKGVATGSFIEGAGIRTAMSGARYISKGAGFTLGGVVGAGISGAVLAGAFGAWRGRKMTREKLDKRDKDIEEGKITDKKKGDKQFEKVDHLIDDIKKLTLRAEKGDKESKDLLAAQIFYTRKKLDDRQIIFGKQKEALGYKLNLLQTMNEAEAKIQAQTGEKGNKEIGLLKKTLKNCEEVMSKERKELKSAGAYKGAVTAGIFSGVGFLGSHFALSHFVHDEIIKPIAHDNPALSPEVEKETLQRGVEQATRDLTEHDIDQEIRGQDMTKIKNFVMKLPETKPVQTPDLQQVSSPDVAPSIEHVIQNESHILASERESRESALIKYFKENGHEKTAGRDAHLKLKELFGKKGEEGLPPVHKGDQVVFIEEHGELVGIKVIPRAKVEMLTEVIKQNAPSLGYKGDVSNIKELNQWSLEGSKEVFENQPELGKTLHNGVILDLHRTPTGGWFAELKGTPTPIETPPLMSGPQIIETLKEYTTPDNTNAFAITEEQISLDSRFNSLPSQEKHRVAFKFLIDNYINRKPLELQKMGIPDGNPWEIKKGIKINLLAATKEGVNPITEALKAKGDKSLDYGAWLFEDERNLEAFYQKMNNLPPEIKEINIGAIIKSIRENK